MVALSLSRRSVGLISAIILARILSPADYGVVAIGLLCVFFFQVLTEMGIQTNLIQERKHDQILLSTAWTLEVIRGLFILILIQLFASTIAIFFNKPEATPIIRVLGLIPFIKSFANIKIVYFQKDLHFNKLFIYEFCGAVGGVLSAVVTALVLRNAWALVFGQLTSTIICTILSYVFFPEIPKLSFDGNSILKLYSFGKWVLFGTIISYFALEGDKYFVGKLFGIEVLGIYKMASMLVNIIVQEFGKSITKVLYPAYSKISRDKQKLKNSFLKSYEIILSMIAPACLGLYIITDDLVPILWGNKWLEMIPIMKLISLAGLARVFFISGSGLFYSLNKPQYNFYCEIFRASVLLVSFLILPGIFGISGIAISLIIANIMVYFIYLFLWRSILQINKFEFIQIYFPIMLSLSGMFGSLLVIKMNFNSGGVRLGLTILCGIISYSFILYLLHKIYSIGPFCFIKNFLKANNNFN